MTAYVPGLDETDPKKIIQSLQQLAAGRSNAVGSVTLVSSGTSTTVTDDNCAAGSTIVLTPATVNAATEIGGGTLYIPAATIANGSFVIQHSSDIANRIFTYAICG